MPALMTVMPATTRAHWQPTRTQGRVKGESVPKSRVPKTTSSARWSKGAVQAAWQGAMTDACVAAQRAKHPLEASLSPSLLVLLPLGCGTKQADRLAVHPVRGQIVFQGKPLPNALAFCHTLWLGRCTPSPVVPCQVGTLLYGAILSAGAVYELSIQMQISAEL